MGLPGTGKTFSALQLTSSAYRCIYFSPVWEEYHAPGRRLVTTRELERYPGLLDDPHARLVVKCSESKAAVEVRELLNHIRAATRYASRDAKRPRGFVVVLDEVGDYKHPESTLISYFRRSRHDHLAVLLLSQLTTDIPLRCRKMASRATVFGQEHEGELEELGSTYGKEFEQQVRTWQAGSPPAVWRSRTYAGRMSD